MQIQPLEGKKLSSKPGATQMDIPNEQPIEEPKVLPNSAEKVASLNEQIAKLKEKELNQALNTPLQEKVAELKQTEQQTKVAPKKKEAPKKIVKARPDLEEAVKKLKAGEEVVVRAGTADMAPAISPAHYLTFAPCKEYILGNVVLYRDNEELLIRAIKRIEENRYYIGSSFKKEILDTWIDKKNVYGKVVKKEAPSI